MLFRQQLTTMSSIGATFPAGFKIGAILIPVFNFAQQDH
ncbi:hypothetical protein EPIR_1375 [Erwinia piriflorinigrans CFBP 5888]|uniref:Uncharacterized protein n=1 Tax=Erwinia piriflorinigrans CFBP 5888 TaxID=1161919 RepID=V5Z6T6_9GAMM|nr:hypothetical protein EPIR_1375 [Erwinia piriflorinigrans CFBP 5888]